MSNSLSQSLELSPLHSILVILIHNMTQETENAPKTKMDLEILTLEYYLTYHKSAIFTKYNISVPTRILLQINCYNFTCDEREQKHHLQQAIY
jgi:hypothetical protein